LWERGRGRGNGVKYFREALREALNKYIFSVFVIPA
jgi:hypothetical protein